MSKAILMAVAPPGRWSSFPRLRGPRLRAPRLRAPRLWAPRLWAPRLRAPRLRAPRLWAPRLRSQRPLLAAAYLAAMAATLGGPAGSAWADTGPTRLQASDLTLQDSIVSRPLLLLGALALLTLLPFAVLMVTSFVKISVVLSIIRSALGTPQIPPTPVITGLSIILTVYVMTPVGQEVYRNIEGLLRHPKPKASLTAAQTIRLVLDVGQRAEGPIKAFLSRHAHRKDRALFYGMARRLQESPERPTAMPAVQIDDFLVLVPSFVISELKEAFQIGFIIFVPFLVIDMVVSNILMALGMQMLSPTTISLPFKLLLFVTIDGWHLVAKGLIRGYI